MLRRTPRNLLICLVSLTRRLHAVGPLEEKPYHTCNIILVQNVEEDSRSESSVGNEEEDLLDVEPPSYAAVNRLGLQQ